MDVRRTLPEKLQSENKPALLRRQEGSVLFGLKSVGGREFESERVGE